MFASAAPTVVRLHPSPEQARLAAQANSWPLGRLVSSAENLLLPERRALPSAWRRFLAGCCCGALNTREELDALDRHARDSQAVAGRRLAFRQAMREELNGRFWHTELQGRQVNLSRDHTTVLELSAERLGQLDNGRYVQHVQALSQAVHTLRGYEAAVVTQWSDEPDAPIPREQIPQVVQAMLNQRLDDAEVIQRVQYLRGLPQPPRIFARVREDTRQRIAREFQNACQARMRRMQSARQHVQRYGEPRDELRLAGGPWSASAADAEADLLTYRSASELLDRVIADFDLSQDFAPSRPVVDAKAARDMPAADLPPPEDPPAEEAADQAPAVAGPAAVPSAPAAVSVSGAIAPPSEPAEPGAEAADPAAEVGEVDAPGIGLSPDKRLRSQEAAPEKAKNAHSSHG